MHLKIIEATNAAAGGINWGKFLVGRFDQQEWQYRSQIDPEARGPLLRTVGWGPEHLMVMDLQTGEGAMFRPGGVACADLDKHRVWVCPMFQPFLEWLYKQDLTDLNKLPSVVEIADPTSALSGYRRPGKATRARAGWPMSVHLAIWGACIAVAGIVGITAAWWRMLNT